MKLAFVYAGQGSQKPGMGLDLYEAYPEFSKVIDELAGKVDFDLKATMFTGDGEFLNQTEVTQPCLAAYAAGVTAVLYAKGIVPEVTLGLSLGEYSALHASGVFTAEELVETTAFRGKAMAKAGEGIETLMCAVLGLTSEQTEEACRLAEEESAPDQWVRVVNYNTTGQEVISGTKDAVKLAEEKAKEMGAKRCMELKVSSAFHTHLMEDASASLASRFAQQEFHEMNIPVIFNATAQEKSEEESIENLLVRQVKSPVKMKQSIELLEKMGITDVIEIGPGHAISGFIKRAAKGIQTYSVEDTKTMTEVLTTFERN